LKQIFEASPNVTSVFRMEGQDLRRTWVSPNLERLFGYNVEESLQPHWWSTHVHPEDVARVITDSSRILTANTLSTSIASSPGRRGGVDSR